MRRQLGQTGDGDAAQAAAWHAYEVMMLACAKVVPAAERRAGLYSTATHRDDLVELMQALQARFGYRGFVLYGASYGSRLALETARVAPAVLIERVVLDGFYAPGIDLDVRYLRTLDESVRDFEAWCAVEPSCDGSGGGLGERLQAALDRVARTPLSKTVDLGDWDPEQPRLDLRIDASSVLAIVVHALTVGEHAAALPRALDDIAAGHWTPRWDTLAQDAAFATLDCSFSPLAFHLVECRDNARALREQYMLALQDAPRFAPLCCRTCRPPKASAIASTFCRNPCRPHRRRSIRSSCRCRWNR